MSDKRVILVILSVIFPLLSPVFLAVFRKKPHTDVTTA